MIRSLIQIRRYRCSTGSYPKTCVETESKAEKNRLDPRQSRLQRRQRLRLLARDAANDNVSTSSPRALDTWTHHRVGTTMPDPRIILLVPTLALAMAG